MSTLLPLVLAATVACTPCTAAPQAPTCPQSRPLTVTTLCLINQVRAAHGAPRLRFDPRLARVAREHSRDMVRRRYFSHVSPDGLASSDRIARSGWMRNRKRWTVGENIAWRIAPARPRAIVRAWLRSRPHREVMLNRRYRAVGIGIAGRTPAAGPGATYTADFGS